VRLEQEVEKFRAGNAQLRQLLSEMQAQLATATVRIAELEAQVKRRGGPPALVKPNRRQAPSEPQPRKKRAAEHNTLRKGATPTRIERHVSAQCPECRDRLRARARITAGRCSSCRRRNRWKLPNIKW
jgi:hypothetical protein